MNALSLLNQWSINQAIQRSLSSGAQIILILLLVLIGLIIRDSTIYLCNILVALNSLYVVSIIINIIFSKADKLTEEEIEGKIELFKKLFKFVNRLY